MASDLAARARRSAPTIPSPPASICSSAGADPPPPEELESTDFNWMPARMLARRSPRPSGAGAGLFSLEGGGGGLLDPPPPPGGGGGGPDPPTGGGGGGGGPPTD